MPNKNDGSVRFAQDSLSTVAHRGALGAKGITPAKPSEALNNSLSTTHHVAALQSKLSPQNSGQHSQQNSSNKKG